LDKLVEEGQVKLVVPDVDKLSKKNPFFNPFMKINRDFTVSIIKILKTSKFLDGLSACGALAVRVAKETESEVTACEINQKTFEFLRKNIELNGVNIKIRALNTSLNLLMNLNQNPEELYDFIDVDPFGSPVKFLDNIFLNSRHMTVIGVTATDTASLCGTYPKTCERKYLSVSMKTDFYNEAGLRILIGYIARTAAKYSFGIEVLFSYALQHYFKVYFRIKKSRKFADECLKTTKFIQYCDECLNRRYAGIDEMKESCVCKKKFKNFGPLWAGEFAQQEFCNMLEKEVEDTVEKKIIRLVREEQSVKIPYYNVHKICKKYGFGIPSMDKILERENRIKRTHFSGTGIRFDGSIEALKEIIS